MIQFMYCSRCQSYLIAVRRKPCQCGPAQYPLRQFTVQSFVKRRRGISCPRYPHRLIHITPSAQRISYRSAQTRRRSAKRLYFRRMIMSFVFKHYQPVFILSVDIHLDRHRTCVDLVTAIQIIKIPLFRQYFGSKRRHVHQTLVFILPAFIHLCKFFPVKPVRLLNGLYITQYLYGFYMRKKSRMPAVIAPISVYHFYFCTRRLSSFLPEILLHKSAVFIRHRKTLSIVIIPELTFTHLYETGLFLPHDRRRFCRDTKRINRRFPAFPALHRIYQILLYLFFFFCRYAAYKIKSRAPYRSIRPSGQDLYTL